MIFDTFLKVYSASEQAQVDQLASLESMINEAQTELALMQQNQPSASKKKYSTVAMSPSGRTNLTHVTSGVTAANTQHHSI
jgi:hypothetical protein